MAEGIEENVLEMALQHSLWIECQETMRKGINSPWKFRPPKGVRMGVFLVKKEGGCLKLRRDKKREEQPELSFPLQFMNSCKNRKIW